MSSYGRAKDAAWNVLEAFGVDPQMTMEKWWTRDAAGNKRLDPLVSALTDAVYDAAFDMGVSVATLRLTKHLEAIMQPPTPKTPAPD